MDKRNERHEFNANRSMWTGVERRVQTLNPPISERRNDMRAYEIAERAAIIKRLGA